MRWLRDIDRWFAQSVLPHEQALIAVARKLLGSKDAARDLVQDVLTEVIAERRWQSIVNPRVYLMRMVYTRSLSELRRRKIVPFQALPKFETLFFADLNPDAFTIVDSRQRMELVLAAIQSLSPQCRQSFILCRVQGLTAEEAGQMLGIKASSVRSHVARGLAILTARLDSALNGSPSPTADLRNSSVRSD